MDLNYCLRRENLASSQTAVCIQAHYPSKCVRGEHAIAYLHPESEETRFTFPEMSLRTTIMTVLTWQLVKKVKSKNDLFQLCLYTFCRLGTALSYLPSDQKLYLCSFVYLCLVSINNYRLLHNYLHNTTINISDFADRWSTICVEQRKVSWSDSYKLCAVCGPTWIVGNSTECSWILGALFFGHGDSEPRGTVST